MDPAAASLLLTILLNTVILAFVIIIFSIIRWYRGDKKKEFLDEQLIDKSMFPMGDGMS